jgi:hypothetical protein
LSVRENGVAHLSERDCWEFVRYFDSDKDNGLNFKEFMEAILPCDDLFLRSDVTQRPPSDCPSHKRLLIHIETEIAALFEKEIEYHQILSVTKADLVRKKDWSTCAAMLALDPTRDGFFGFNHILSFCRLNRYNISDN